MTDVKLPLLLAVVVVVFSGRTSAETAPVADKAAAERYWADLDRVEKMAQAIHDEEDAREKAKADSGRFSRATRLARQITLDRLNFFIATGEVQDAADLFRSAVNKCRAAYFTYLAVPVRIEKLGEQVSAGWVDQRAAADRFGKLQMQLDQAVADLGYYRDDYLTVVKHLNDIIKSNKIVDTNIVFETMRATRSRELPDKKISPASVAESILATLLTEKNLNGRFPEFALEELRGLPTEEQLLNVYWKELEAQLAHLRRQTRDEKAARRRMGLISYPMITLLKAVVDSRWVPAGARVLIHDWIYMSYDLRVRTFQMPLIRVILRGGLKGQARLEQVFDLNAMSRNDELLVTMYRIVRSPDGVPGLNIKDLWYEMKTDAKALSEQRAKQGFSENEFSRMLKRMEQAEGWARRLRDLSMYHDGQSPLEKRFVCALALGAAGVSAGTSVYANWDKLEPFITRALHSLGLL